LAHASRGRPSHRRLPQRVRDRILQLARTTYAGFNDHHLREKLVEHEGFSLGREALRRLLRLAIDALPLIVSAACRALARARCCCWMAAFTAGWKIAARNLPCSAFWTTPPAKFWSPHSLPPKTRAAIFACSS